MQSAAQALSSVLHSVRLLRPQIFDRRQTFSSTSTGLFLHCSGRQRRRWPLSLGVANSHSLEAWLPKMFVQNELKRQTVQDIISNDRPSLRRRFDSPGSVAVGNEAATSHSQATVTKFLAAIY